MLVAERPTGASPAYADMIDRRSSICVSGSTCACRPRRTTRRSGRRCSRRWRRGRRQTAAPRRERQGVRAVERRPGPAPCRDARATSCSGTRSGCGSTSTASCPSRSGRRASPCGAFVPGQDDEAVYEAQQDAFADDFEHARWPYENWRRWAFTESFDPSLWLVAEDGDEIAGVCLCRAEAGAERRAGVGQRAGCAAPWRRRGSGARSCCRRSRSSAHAASAGPASASTVSTRREPCGSTSGGHARCTPVRPVPEVARPRDHVACEREAEARPQAAIGALAPEARALRRRGRGSRRGCPRRRRRARRAARRG